MAWLSYHYPLEFAVANCTINGEQEEITATLALARRRKLPIFPPDINRSQNGFSVDNGGIRYGLKAIKGLGISALAFIHAYRSVNSTPFKDFKDYYSRVHLSQEANDIIAMMQQDSEKKVINPLKKDVEVALILSGCFDYYEQNRYKVLNEYAAIRKEKSIKIMDSDTAIPVDEKTYSRKTKLALEKFYMGTYISEHPLDSFPYADIESARENEMVETSGIVSEASMKKTKNGKKYITIKFTEKNDIVRTVNMFSEDRAVELKRDIKKGSIIIIKGRVSKRYNNISATSIKIAVASKQTVVTEDMVIEESEPRLPDQSLFSSPEPVTFGNLFS
jgi:DNA polymerase-3 subunit alpha